MTPRKAHPVVLRGVLSWTRFAGICALIAACSQKPMEVLEIERLAFVPGGHISVSIGRMGAAEALLVDRFETTRELWKRFLTETNRSDWVGWTLFQSPPGERHLGKLPAVGMDWKEAVAYADWRGMRLPEVSEWLWIAAGPRAQAYPYGTSPADSAANTTELALLAPTPVGTFHTGRTPGDPIYDLEGNVSEWVHWSKDSGPPWFPRGARADDGLHLSTWVMGGSFLTHSRPLFKDGDQGLQVNGVELSSGTRANDVGVRPVIEARSWLLEHMPDYADTSHKARLIGVGRAWGNRSVNLLSELVKLHPEQPMLGWLLEGARG
ncbi:MAG: formylglycine-generating enzyme family protein [bacterium]|nr:formylglycine-generating enzyme family protein [bacterium]